MSIETINQTNTIESEKTVEQILRENPELDESKYQEYLDIRLNSNQERQLLKQELDAEHLEEIKSNSLSEQNNISQGYERAGEIIEEERRNSENNNENNIENFTSRLNEATQSAGQQVRERASEIKETVEKSEGISNVFSWLEQAKEKGGIMGFIAGIILGIAGAFGYKKEVNEQIQEARETIENALEPEQITETKNTVKDTINNSLGDYITPQNREILNRSIDGLSQEQINQLYHSIESGDFGIDDIQRIAPNIFTEILDEAQLEQIKQNIETTIIEKLSQTIKEEYGIDVELNQEKKAELENLVRDNLELSDERIMEIREIVEKKEFRYSDLSEFGGEVMFNSVNVMFGLISKGIVPMSNFTFNFVEASGKMIAIGAGALGISENISFENFQEKIEDMNESEKAMFVGMLYRKGGLFLSIVSNISEQVSRLAITSVTSTTVSSTSLLSASAMNNFSAQADNIDKIARTLDPSNLTDHKNILRAATDNLAKVRENYVMMDIIQGLEGDNAKKYGDLTRRLIEEKIEIPRHATDSFDDLIKQLGQKNDFTPSASIRGTWNSVKSKIGVGANADLLRLNKKLETISNAQKRMFNPNFLTGGLSRLRESIHIPEISRMGDRLSFHFDSPSQAKDALRRLNIIANQTPDLLKGIIDKAPIIMVAGVAANSEEGVIESLKEQVPFLMPIVGPIAILLDSGWSWEDGIPKPIDPMNIGIGTALLTVDGVIAGKEFVRGGARGVLGYMIKPFMDVYSMARGTGDIVYYASRTVARGGVRSGLSHLGREAMRRVKNVPGGNKVRALALIGVVGYIGINQMLKDGEQIEGTEDLMTNGELDMDKISEARGELTDGQKEDVISTILEEEEQLEGLEVRVIADRMLIRSRNPNIKEDWFINDEHYGLFEMLQINPDYDFEYVANA